MSHRTRRTGNSGGGPHTLGKTGTQETRNLLDQSLGSDKSIVLSSELLDELLVLVQLLEVVGRHGIDTTVLGTIDIVLITEDADAHVGPRDSGQADGARETLVTGRVIVLETDLEPDDAAVSNSVRVCDGGRVRFATYSTVSRKLRFFVSSE